MSLTYSTYLTQLITLNSIASSTDTNFQNILPGCIDYAEQRIYREGDFLATRVTDTSGAVSSGVRTLALSTAQGNFLVVEEINIWTPVGATAGSATRNPVTRASQEFIDAVFPAASQQTTVPLFWAPRDNTTVIFGPAPDAAYTAEVVGTQRPTPLSSGNSSTFLTQYLPDLFMAASMVYMAGYQRDFGAQSENPQLAQSWETQYKQLFASANVEELRKKYQSGGWTHTQPSPIATPQRV